MTSPRRMAPADPATYAVSPLGIDASDGNERGPANAIIARLAHAIAEQNAANATDPAPAEGQNRSMPSLGWFMALGAGSASLWLAVILIGHALL